MAERSRNLNIRSHRDLALRLSIGEAYIHGIAFNMDAHVRPFLLSKNGKTRQIYRPSRHLKQVQKIINSILLQPLWLPPTLHGSVPRKSPTTNAQIHIRKPLVVSLDIKDFYPSVHYTRVYRLFIRLGCVPDVARLLTRLTTFDGHLAQGFPTSPAIANLILREIEPRFAKLREQHGLVFTFYQDDLTISGEYRIMELVDLFVRILQQCGFRINRGKIRRVMQKRCQKVTGWVVNTKVNVSKDEYRALRALLHNCEKFGIESQADRPLEAFRQHIRGRIQRILEVNPARGRKLLTQFERL